MSHIDVVRAWKDELYRASLSQEELARLPDHPAGLIELGDGDLNGVAGASTELLLTFGCCSGFTSDWDACAVVVGTVAVITCVASAALGCEITVGACHQQQPVNGG